MCCTITILLYCESNSFNSDVVNWLVVRLRLKAANIFQHNYVRLSLLKTVKTQLTTIKEIISKYIATKSLYNQE